MVNKKELKIGTKVEMEHTKSKTFAAKIAKDHLKEFPHYYTVGLLPMEKRLKKRKLYKHRNCLSTRKMLSNVPDYEEQAERYTKINLKGGRK